MNFKKATQALVFIASIVLFTNTSYAQAPVKACLEEVLTQRLGIVAPKELGGAFIQRVINGIVPVVAASGAGFFQLDPNVRFENALYTRSSAIIVLNQLGLKSLMIEGFDTVFTSDDLIKKGCFAILDFTKWLESLNLDDEQKVLAFAGVVDVLFVVFGEIQNELMSLEVVREDTGLTPMKPNSFQGIEAIATTVGAVLNPVIVKLVTGNGDNLTELLQKLATKVRGEPASVEAFLIARSLERFQALLVEQYNYFRGKYPQKKSVMKNEIIPTLSHVFGIYLTLGRLLNLHDGSIGNTFLTWVNTNGSSKRAPLSFLELDDTNRKLTEIPLDPR